MLRRSTQYAKTEVHSTWTSVGLSMGYPDSLGRGRGGFCSSGRKMQPSRGPPRLVGAESTQYLRHT